MEQINIKNMKISFTINILIVIMTVATIKVYW